VDRVCTILCSIVDVKLYTPDKSADLGFQSCIRNEPERLPLPFRCGCGSYLDDVNTNVREKCCDVQLIIGFQRYTGGLFPVTQCRV